MILLAHQDYDHGGGLSRILEQHSPTVVAHEIAAPVIDGRKEPRSDQGSDRYPPSHIDIEISGRTTINTQAGQARVIETSGHTPGHISLYLPEEKLLIAGDALGFYEDGLAAPEPEVTMDVETAHQSIARLAELDIDQVLCYHGGLSNEGTDRLKDIASVE